MSIMQKLPGRRGIQAVRADGADGTKILNEIKAAFEALKTESEAELKQIKTKLSADVVTVEKVDRINADITKLQSALDQVNVTLAAARLGGGAGDELTPDAREHATAFNRFFRKGVDAGLHDLEVKAKLTTQSDPDGGYLVPTQMEKAIDRVLGTVSSMRSLSRVLPVSTGAYKKLVSMGGAGAGWVGEEEGRTETATPNLRELIFNVAEIYAQPAITQTALDDSAIDIAEWLADEVSVTIAEKEGAAFINGNGLKQPRGILQYDTVANASHTWGKLGFTVTGAAAAFNSTNPADALIELYYSLKAGYRNGATFLMSDAILGTLRKWKDGDGNYLWAPPATAEAPGTILGKPVETDDNMPGLGANAFPVAFGNFKRGYLIVDRTGIRVLRDQYTSKPNVLFYTTKRVGGGVQNFEAIKLLKCST